MKKQIGILLFFLIQMALSAQTTATTEGVVLYDEKVNMHRRMDNEEAKAMVPEWRITKSYLTFRGDECTYKPVEEDEDEQEMGGGNVRIRMMRPYYEVYRNFASEKSIEQREMQGKKYLIEDSLKVRAWKIVPETKKVLGYECMKATFSDTARKQEVVAWFTNDISLPAGPNALGSLPGLILEVDMNKGETIMAATKIDFKKVKDDELKPPTKGEKITQAEFQKKMDEFRKQMGNGRGMRIIRN
jgi:GLPGLI family protein